MDETPVTPILYRYEFYTRQGAAVVQIPIQVISPKDIDHPDIRNAIDQIRGQLAQQQGIGLVPRPAYYSATELHPMPVAEGDDKQPIALVLPTNGRV